VQTLRDIAPYLALGAAVVDVVLLVLLIVVVRRLGRLRRAQQAVLGAHGERDLVAHAHDLGEQVRNLREAVEILDGRLTGYKTELRKAFTHRALVRYDAFRDIGGGQSTSIALLDDTASGVVISMIHSRDYARIYVKELRQSVPDRALSPEEVQVVEAAMAAAGEAQHSAGEAQPSPPAAPAPPAQSAPAPPDAAPPAATPPTPAAPPPSATTPPPTAQGSPPSPPSRDRPDDDLSSDLW